MNEALTDDQCSSITDSYLENNSSEYLERENLIKSQMCMIQAKEWLKYNFKFVLWDSSIFPFPQIHQGNTGNRMLEIIISSFLSTHCEIT